MCKLDFYCHSVFIEILDLDHEGTLYCCTNDCTCATDQNVFFGVSYVCHLKHSSVLIAYSALFQHFGQLQER